MLAHCSLNHQPQMNPKQIKHQAKQAQHLKPFQRNPEGRSRSFNFFQNNQEFAYAVIALMFFVRFQNIELSTLLAERKHW